MKVCIYGAGAIGGVIAAHLIRNDPEAEVTLVARGAHLAALSARGLVWRTPQGEETLTRLTAVEDASAVPPQDVVIVALKATGLAAAADRIAQITAADGMIVAAQNGLPWWYFHGEGGPHDGQPLPAVDPGGQIWQQIAPPRVIGCVLYIAASTPEPGVVDNPLGRRLILGEPDGRRTPRLERLGARLAAAGMDVILCPDAEHGRIRDALWSKLLNNLTQNPISVLTDATTDVIGTDAGLQPVLRRMLEEAEAVANRFGIRLDRSIDVRLAGPHRLAFRTSMLQDYDAGRPLETDCILGAVIALGRLAGIATPTLETVLALTDLRARMRPVRPAAFRAT